MSPRLNLTYPTALVLQALARGFHHGFDIMDATGLPSGTVYPILRRLDREGLLTSAWEKQSTAQREQRPPRRYYDITPAGAAMLADAVDAVPGARAGRAAAAVETIAKPEMTTVTRSGRAAVLPRTRASLQRGRAGHVSPTTGAASGTPKSATAGELADDGHS